MEIDSRELQSKLLPFLESNKRKTSFLLISTLAVFFLLHALILISDNTIIKLILSLIVGALMIRIFSFYHDMTHGAIFKKSPIGRFILSLYGIYVLSPPSVWERTHKYHHDNNMKHENSFIGAFPIVTKSSFNKLSKKEQNKYYALRSWKNVFFGYFTVFFGGMSLTPAIKKGSVDCIIAVVLHVSLSVFLAYWNLNIYLFNFFIPIFFSSFLGALLFYLQHSAPNIDYHFGKQKWDYTFSALHSSTFVDLPRILHWFTGNIGFHHIHHLNPSVPFYNLSTAMNSIPELAPLVVVKPRDIPKCFRLHLFDEETRTLTN